MSKTRPEINIRATLNNADMTVADLRRVLGRTWKGVDNWVKGVTQMPPDPYDLMVKHFKRIDQKIYFF